MRKTKILAVVLALVLGLSMLLTGCKNNKKPKDSSDASSGEVSASASSGDVSTSNSQTNSSSNRPLPSVSRADDEFDYSSKPNTSQGMLEAPSAAASAYPTLNAVYKIDAPDGSYNGTNKDVGFSVKQDRTNGSFTTYPVGYGEGTTGGRGAKVDDIYECATGLEVKAALSAIKEKQKTDANLRSIIKVTAEINQRNTTESEITDEKKFTFQIIVDSIDNLTLIGANANAVFDGVGVNFKSCDNIIVQNLTITHPSRILKNEKDCLEFNTCNYVWVDHCELYNDYPSNSGEKDYFDGLVDIKNESSHVTVSYNYLHDAFKTSLVGSGSSDIYEQRTVTYHHNIFKNLNSRVPAYRSGYAHVYNNYYENILGSAINCRIEAQVYIEGNIFKNTKRPICANEDAVIGFYNIASDNVYESCSAVIDYNTSTTDFTPSYQYIYDNPSTLKAYLDQTVGVNKIDVATQIADDIGYQNKYVIPEEKLIIRAIDELTDVKFDNNTKQRLLYLSKAVLFASDSVRGKITNLSKLTAACESYVSLFAADLDKRISDVSFDSEFGSNALSYLSAKTDYEEADKIIKDLVKNKSKLDALTADYSANLKNHFNKEVAALANAGADKMTSVTNMLDLYYALSDSEKSGLEFEKLKEAYINSFAHVKADEFEKLVGVLPEKSNLTFNDDAKVIKAANAYNALTKKQYSFVDKTVLAKFEDLYQSLINAPRKMDLSKVSNGKVATDYQAAGGIALSKNMEVEKNISVSFGGKTYAERAYISGYGNRGSKSIWFSLYGESEIKVVLASQTAGCKFSVADTEGNVLQTYSVENNSVTEITISGLKAGEYRFYTAMPNKGETVYTDSKAYVYDFIVIAK